MKEKIIGKWFNLDIVLRGDTNDYDEIVDIIQEKLGEIESIYFYDCPEGHHPAFFKKHPGLLSF